MAAQTAAPRLLRAVAETTQPYGPLLEGNALHTLQVPQSLSTIHMNRLIELCFALP